MYKKLILILLSIIITDYYCNGYNNNIDKKKISCTGYDITPWSKERILIESKKVYSIDDVRYHIIQNEATEKSYTGKFFNGERYNHKGEGIYVSGINYILVYDYY
jgi:hypothetical protein